MRRVMALWTLALGLAPWIARAQGGAASDAPLVVLEEDLDLGLDTRRRIEGSAMAPGAAACEPPSRGTFDVTGSARAAYGLHDIYGGGASIGLGFTTAARRFRFSADAELWPRRYMQTSSFSGAQFVQGNVGLGACVFALDGAIRPEACIDARAGGIYARGHSLDRKERTLRFAGGAGGLLGVRFEFPYGLAIDVRAGGRIPLPRLHLYYEAADGSEVRLFEQGNIAPLADVSVSWQFE